MLFVRDAAVIKTDKFLGSFLAAQWLGLGASTSGGAGLIPGRGTKILHAAGCGQKKEKKELGIGQDSWLETQRDTL